MNAEIDIADLRDLASRWHSGQGSPLYAFSSSGTVVEGASAEAEQCIEVAHGMERASLKYLVDYLIQREAEDMRYKVTRFFYDPNKPPKTIHTGLTLEEAQEHCNDPETSSGTCTKPFMVRYTEDVGCDWFDGYEQE